MVVEPAGAAVGSVTDGTVTRRDGSGISTPAVDDRLERAVPVVAEVDVVVAQVRRGRARGAHVPHDGRGGEVAGAHGPRRGHAGQQPVVGDRQVEGAHHGVGGEPLAVGGGDADHGAVGAPQHLAHLDAQVHRHPGVGERLRHAPRHRVHAALGVEDAAHGVHVGDDGQHGAGLGGGDAGVERLEAEDAGEPVVGEEPVDGRARARPARRAAAAGPRWRGSARGRAARSSCGRRRWRTRSRRAARARRGTGRSPAASASPTLVRISSRRSPMSARMCSSLPSG